MKNDSQYQVQEITISPAKGFTVAETKEGYQVKPSKLLMNESPLQLLPTLACFIGDRHATLLQQLYYLENNLQGEIDELGNKWVRVVIDGKERITWCKIMPYLERCTIRQILEDLEKEGFIKSRNFTGRPLYYRVDKDAVDKLTEPVARICKAKKRGRVITPSIVYKSDDKSIVYKSDDNHLINRQSSSNNQTNIVYKLDTSENTLDSTKNPQTTTTATAFLSEQVVIPETVQNSPNELVVAYCNALEWSTLDDKALGLAEKGISEIRTGEFKDITASEISMVINHAIQVHGLKPAQFRLNWKKCTNEALMMQRIEISGIVGALKQIYGKELTYKQSWEYSLVASQMWQFYKTTPEQVLLFAEMWRGKKDKTGKSLALPGIDKIFSNINIIKEQQNDSTKPNIDPFHIPAGGKLARVTFM